MASETEFQAMRYEKQNEPVDVKLKPMRIDWEKVCCKKNDKRAKNDNLRNCNFAGLWHFILHPI